MSEADLTTHHIEGIARMGNRPFKVELYSHIQGNLWTGGNPVQAVPEDFKYVISLYQQEPYQVHPHQVITQAMLFDHGSVPDPEVLEVLARHVNECVEAGKTLVHCQAGLNRSGLVAALALIRQGKPAAEAIALLREKRCDAVLCNAAFEEWLLTQ